MKKSRSTRSHFTHARNCSRALNQVPTRAKQPASIRTYSLLKGDIFPFDRFTGYKKSNQNQFGRVLPFAFALTCYKIYLFLSSLSDFDSFSWRVHLSYGVCRLRARVQLKTLSSLLKWCLLLNLRLVCELFLTRWDLHIFQILSNHNNATKKKTANKNAAGLRRRSDQPKLNRKTRNVTMMQGWYYVESLIGQQHDRVQTESQEF